jgi:ketosteroid isomerase-like protein
VIPIDDPEALAEMHHAFARYERALIANDVDTLVELFLDAPTTIRYGIDEIQHGHDEIAAYRRSSVIAAPPRELLNTVITTFGRDTAVANTEFVPVGSDAVGRQSQTWVRTNDGWRIASAHVSWLGGRAP